MLAGKGDVAANLLLTFERDEQVAFATPIETGIRELVVTGPGTRRWSASRTSAAAPSTCARTAITTPACCG